MADCLRLLVAGDGCLIDGKTRTPPGMHPQRHFPCRRHDVLRQEE
jgi:hypothetical protein